VGFCPPRRIADCVMHSKWGAAPLGGLLCNPAPPEGEYFIVCFYLLYFCSSYIPEGGVLPPSAGCFATLHPPEGWIDIVLPFVHSALPEFTTYLYVTFIMPESILSHGIDAVHMLRLQNRPRGGCLLALMQSAEDEKSPAPTRGFAQAFRFPNQRRSALCGFFAALLRRLL